MADLTTYADGSTPKKGDYITSKKQAPFGYYPILRVDGDLRLINERDLVLGMNYSDYVPVTVGYCNRRLDILSDNIAEAQEQIRVNIINKKSVQRECKRLADAVDAMNLADEALAWAKAREASHV